MPSKNRVKVYSTTRNNSQNYRLMGQYLNKSCLLSLPWLRIRTTVADIQKWRRLSALLQRSNHFFLYSRSTTLSFAQILSSCCPSCFAVLALNHHSCFSLSNNLKLILSFIYFNLLRSRRCTV